MKYFVIPAIIGATGIVTRGLKNIWKQYQESIQQILCKKSSSWNITHYKESLSGGVHHWFRRKSTRKNLRKENKK
jgi:uncharacterized membrane protein